MYIAKSGTFDENNSLLKLGRVRLSFQPNPFEDTSFEQRLLLNSGYVRFTGKDNATAKIWVDVFNPVVHVEIDSPEKISMKLAYENWRFEDRELVNEERNQGSWGLYTSKVKNGTTYADKIDFHENGVLMSHRNEKLDLWDFQIKQQGLEAHADKMYNPMRNSEFGIFVHSEQLWPGNITSGSYVNTTFKAWNLDTKTARKSFKVALTLHQAQTSSHKEWYEGLKKIAKSAVNATQEATLDWWRAWWERSYIIINEDKGESDPGFQVGKNYQIFRYLMGCNAKGDWPTKFNGGLWTFDPVYVNKYRPFTPDHRRWGGGTFTAQNQRLLYWPLLKSGDFDVMTQQFDFYKRITPNAVLRGQVYQGIDAAYFLEQIDNTGLSNVFEYNAQYYDDEQNTPRPDFFPDGELWNVWLNHMQDTAKYVPSSPIHSPKSQAKLTHPQRICRHDPPSQHLLRLRHHPLPRLHRTPTRLVRQILHQKDAGTHPLAPHRPLRQPIPRNLPRLRGRNLQRILQRRVHARRAAQSPPRPPRSRGIQAAERYLLHYVPGQDS